MTFHSTSRATVRQFLLPVYTLVRFHVRSGSFQLVCGMALTSLLAAAPAAADSIVFSNLGPGGTYDPRVAYNVSGPASQAEEATAIGQSFVPMADFSFDAVDIALNWLLDTNAGTVSLTSDASGQPGAILESFAFTDRPHASNSNTDLATGISTLHPLLHAGTPYWIVASAEGDAYMVWAINNTGQFGTAFQINGGAWTPRPELASAAFRVRGSAVENVVPEPGSFVLLVTGVAIACRRKRRQMLGTFLCLVMSMLYATGASADPVVWNGPMIAFTKPDHADWTLPINQDRLTDNVWLTRGEIMPLFNIAVEPFFEAGSPVDTEWAFGPTQPGGPGPISARNHATLVFKSFVSSLGGEIGRNAVSYGPGVLHLISDDIYIDIRFTSWTRANSDELGGGFSYIRSTPGQAPVPEPASATLVMLGAAAGAAARRRSRSLAGHRIVPRYILSFQRRRAASPEHESWSSRVA